MIDVVLNYLDECGVIVQEVVVMIGVVFGDFCGGMKQVLGVSCFCWDCVQVFVDVLDDKFLYDMLVEEFCYFVI